jgi:hypothetical protein
MRNPDRHIRLKPSALLVPILLPAMIAVATAIRPLVHSNDHFRLLLFSPLPGESVPTRFTAKYAVLGNESNGLQVCFSVSHISRGRMRGARCHTTEPGVEASVNVDVGSLGVEEAEDWQLEASLQVGNNVVDSRVVPFDVHTSVAAADSASGASFFRASCDVSGDNSRPSAERMVVFLDGELMFRSSGTSNLGRNYPGFWFPMAGVCPQWFALGGGMSFDDAFAMAGGNNSVLASTVLAHPLMFDKRFAPAYRSREAGRVSEWRRVSREIQKSVVNGSILIDRRMTAQCEADIHSGQFMLARFTSLRQAVASVRLSAAAWRASGYTALAEHLLVLGAATGLRVLPVGLVPPRERVIAKRGLCAVNEHIHRLGFEVVGWQHMQRLFRSLPAHVRTRLDYQLSG